MIEHRTILIAVVIVAVVVSTAYVVGQIAKPPAPTQQPQAMIQPRQGAPSFRWAGPNVLCLLQGDGTAYACWQAGKPQAAPPAAPPVVEKPAEE